MSVTLRVFDRIHNGKLDYLHCEVWSYGPMGSVKGDTIDCDACDLTDIIAEYNIDLISIQKTLSCSNDYRAIEAAAGRCEVVSVAG